MRQIGDQWRPSENEEETKNVDLGLDRPLDSEEKTRVDNYYTFKYKTLFNNLCSEKFFNNSTRDFITNFKRCTEKMHQVESIYYAIKENYSREKELYERSGLNNLKY